uniref:Uncharacterized protein n=1 Tax=viral metagenome TaxID=1070528 RepID=A0A6C0F113_9ZZZZ
MSRAVSASTKVPASERPETRPAAEPLSPNIPVWAKPPAAVATSGAPGVSKRPVALMKAPVPETESGAPKA